MTMDVLLTDIQVAEHFGITTRTLLKWRKSGEGPQFLEVGPNTIRYRTSDVLAYESQRATGGHIPERANRAIIRTSAAMAVILQWKMSDKQRTMIETLRKELMDLTTKEAS